jgi:hypothetical protein
VLQARDAGVDDLVAKPISVGALTRKMLSACGRATGAVAAPWRAAS